jgi:hypothetical protein
LRDVFADCRRRNKSTRILLIADQFEEVFTLVEDPAVRQRFIDLLLGGFPDPAPVSRPDICLILALRADKREWVGVCARAEKCAALPLGVGI